MLTTQQKQRIKDRDGGKCVLCKSQEFLTIDHIIPKIAGGGDEDKNLQTLCTRCNQLKSGHYKPPWYVIWWNFLFSRKRYYEFQAEIRGQLLTQKGAIIAQIQQLLDAHKRETQGLVQQAKNIANLPPKPSPADPKMMEEWGNLKMRLMMMEKEMGLVWTETMFKGYLRPPKKRRGRPKKVAEDSIIVAEELKQ